MFKNNFNLILSLLSSLETIIQKTNFSNQNSKCSSKNDSCYSIGKKNIGFTVINSQETNLDKRILGSTSSLSNDQLSFDFLNNSKTSNIFNNFNSNTKSAFFLNTSSSSSILSKVSTISFLVMKNAIVNNLNLQQQSSPSSFLSSIILKDTTNNLIVSSNIIINVAFARLSQENKQQECGFWNETDLKWSTFGCQLKQNSESFYECVCNHTTFFALLGGTQFATSESILVYVYAVCGSIFFGLIVVGLIVKKLTKIDRKGITKIPALYSMISTFFSSVFFILSSVFMIGVLFNKQTTYSTGCGFLAFLEHFTLLTYFFWLLNTIMMYYFTNRFEIDNMLKYFKPLSILSFVIPLLISLILFFISLSSIKVYEISDSM